MPCDQQVSEGICLWGLTCLCCGCKFYPSARSVCTKRRCMWLYKESLFPSSTFHPAPQHQCNGIRLQYCSPSPAALSAALLPTSIHFMPLLLHSADLRKHPIPNIHEKADVHLKAGDQRSLSPDLTADREAT